MTAVPHSTFPSPPPTERLSAQLGVVRELALAGSTGAARQLCSALFLDHAASLTRDRPLLENFVQCLLLLEMSALLPRVVRAIFGVELDMVPLGGPGPRRMLLSFSNGITLAALSPGLRAGRAAREQAAERWGKMILIAAARDGVVADEPASAASNPLVAL